MYLFIDCQLVPSFHIEVEDWDTVFTMKQKIEKSKGFPVSKQTLFFGCKALDNRDLIIQCKIQPNSHLLLTISPDQNPNQNKGQGLHTEQSPSNPVKDYLNNQAWPMMVGRNNNKTLQSPSVPVEEYRNNQGWPVGRNNDQMLQSPPTPSDPVEEHFNNQGWPVMVGRNNDQEVLHQTEKSPMSFESFKEFLDIQDSPETVEGGGSSQVLHQTEESPLSSDLVKELIENKDWPEMVEGGGNQVFRQTEESPLTSDLVKEFLDSQDWPVTVENESNQVLHQAKQWPVSSDSFGQAIYGEGRPFTTNHFSNIQHHWPVTTQETRYCQDSSIPANSRNVLLGTQDFPSVPVWSGSNNTTQVIQTEKSPQSVNKKQVNQLFPESDSDTVKEIITIPDSPVKKRKRTLPIKLTVMVMPFEETRKIPVEVNAGDKVRELRKELYKIQEKVGLHLPPEGFIFIHNGTALDYDWTFREYGVSHGDTIEIFRATFWPSND